MRNGDVACTPPRPDLMARCGLIGTRTGIVSMRVIFTSAFPPLMLPAMPALLDTPFPVTDEQIARYRRDGFVAMDNILHGPDLARLRDAVAGAVADENVPTPRAGETRAAYEQIFIQKVNLWRRHATIREFVTCTRFGQLAARLAGRA